MFGFGRKAKEPDSSNEEEETTYDEYTETASNTEVDQSECETSREYTKSYTKSYSKSASTKKSVKGKILRDGI